MLLSKVNSSRPFRLFKTYSAWLIFCDVVLILTNAFSSLDKIKAYGFHLVDTFLTFGFLIFWGILEAIAVAILLVAVEILLEKITRRQLDLVFRLILAAALLGSWVAVLLSIFHVI